MNKITKRNSQEMIINNCWMKCCDIENNQGQDRGYQPKPEAEADNPYRNLDYSGYQKNRI